MGRRGRGGAIAGPPPLFSDPPPPHSIPTLLGSVAAASCPGEGPLQRSWDPQETKHFFLGRGGVGGGTHSKC